MECLLRVRAVEGTCRPPRLIDNLDDPGGHQGNHNLPEAAFQVLNKQAIQDAVDKLNGERGELGLLRGGEAARRAQRVQRRGHGLGGFHNQRKLGHQRLPGAGHSGSILILDRGGECRNLIGQSRRA